jgi:hypothetical protein
MDDNHVLADLVDLTQEPYEPWVTRKHPQSLHHRPFLVIALVAAISFGTSPLMMI